MYKIGDILEVQRLMREEFGEDFFAQPERRELKSPRVAHKLLVLTTQVQDFEKGLNSRYNLNELVLRAFKRKLLSPEEVS